MTSLRQSGATRVSNGQSRIRDCPLLTESPPPNTPTSPPAPCFFYTRLAVYYRGFAKMAVLWFQSMTWAFQITIYCRPHSSSWIKSYDLSKTPLSARFCAQRYKPFSAVKLTVSGFPVRIRFTRNRSREVCEISGLYLLHRLQA